jgi:hypothetical protein
MQGNGCISKGGLVGVVVQFVGGGVRVTCLLINDVLVNTSLPHLRDARASGGARSKSMGVVEFTTFRKISEQCCWLVFSKLACRLQSTFGVAHKVPPGLCEVIVPTADF